MNGLTPNNPAAKIECDESFGEVVNETNTDNLLSLKDFRIPFSEVLGLHFFGFLFSVVLFFILLMEP